MIGSPVTNNRCHSTLWPSSLAISTGLDWFMHLGETIHYGDEIIDRYWRAWVKHNIEEVGQLEYLLPGLASSGEAEPAQCAQR